MANLVIDIGNTVLKAAWTDGITLGKTYRYQGEMMTDFIISLTAKERPEVIIMASSVKIHDRDIARIEKECGRLIFSDADAIYEKEGLPRYLSPDRMASVVATRHLFNGKGCTVFDFGTTITIDFIDADGKYCGGNISPGCRTRFKSLNRYSRNLPLLDTPETFENKGNSTVSAMESGVISGIIFEVEGYFAENPENIAVFTGGDAIYFAKRIKKPIFVVCNLVLMGLAILADEYVKE